MVLPVREEKEISINPREVLYRLGRSLRKELSHYNNKKWIK